jgi:hypothetical protein
VPDFFHFGGGSEIRTRDGVNHTCFPGKLLVYPDPLQALKSGELLAGLFRSGFKKWYARPVTLRI